MTESLIQNKKIAIVGGGPVGLTTARLLQMQGADVTVYERDAHANARIKGSTLDLHKKTGQRALKKAGLYDAFRQYSRPVGQKVADKYGNILFDMKPDTTKPEIDRADLRKILLESLKPDTVVWDVQVTEINKKDDVFELQFQNGTQTAADLVIVADGGMSKARRYITDTLPIDTGTNVLQGEFNNFKETCPQLSQLCGDSNIAIVEDKKAIFLHIKRDGSICFHVSFRKSEQWIKDMVFDLNDTASINQFLCRLFKDWNPVYQELFNACPAYSGFPLRVFYANEINKPHAGITLVGDAAHIMPPFGGVGVNMGMFDALTLSESLTNGKFENIQAAIDDYEKKMVDYALPVQQETHAADDRIHTQYAHSMGRFKQMKLMLINKVVQTIALCLLMLITGVFWGNWFSFSRAYEAFSSIELTHIAQVIVQNLALPMRFISMACLVFMGLTSYLNPNKKATSFYLSLGAFAFTLSALFITVVVEVPINNQIITWTPTNTPINWEEIRNRWQMYNGIRTISSLTGFGLFVGAIIKPFQSK